MSVYIDWAQKIIHVPRIFLTEILPNVNYSMDTNAFRLALKELEAGAEGMLFPDTHRHNTTVVLGGVTYARLIEIINGYTITFEEFAGPYRVFLSASNNNILDVTNLGTVSVAPNNSAGLIAVEVGDVSAADIAAIRAKTDSLNFTSAGKVDANVKELNDAVVIGTGQSNDKWRGDVL